jgi:glycosyltransferase involved in cell wall biosynthesis
MIARDAFDVMGPHPVYLAVKRMFQRLSQDLGLELHQITPEKEHVRTVYSSKTKHIWYMPLPKGRSNLYLSNSALFALENWNYLIRGLPFIIVEEYLPGGAIRDALASSTHLLFRSIPHIALTRRTYDFLVSLGVKCYLLPPTEKKKLGSKQRSHILLVGRLVESKNPFFALRLAQELPDEQFVIIGNGPLYPELASAAKSMPNVTLINNLESREKLFSYYANAKLFLHLVHKDPIGFVIIEALSTQTPVLSSSGAGASSFLPDEWVVDGFDPKLWEERIRRILANQSKSCQFAQSIFEKEHMDETDPYAEQVESNLKDYLLKKWPSLGKK